MKSQNERSIKLLGAMAIGIVTAGEWQTDTELVLHSPNIPSDIPVFDVFERNWLRSDEHSLKIIIHPQSDLFTGRMAPSGRIYLFGFPIL